MSYLPNTELLKAKVDASGTLSTDVQAILSAKLKNVTDITDTLSTSALPLNYKNNVSSYTESVSSVEPDTGISIGTSSSTVYWANIKGSPKSNSALAALLDAKVDESVTVNGQALSGDVTITKSNLGLAKVKNYDQTDASNLLSGEVADDLLSDNVTKAGNTFNSASTLVKLLSSAKLPALDGSNLYNLPSSSSSVSSVSWSDIEGAVTDNSALSAALAAKVNKTFTINGHALTGSSLTLPTATLSGTIDSAQLPHFNGNRTVKRSGLPLVNVGTTTTVQDFIEAYFFPFISATLSLNSFSLQEIGTSPTMQLVGALTLNDETVVNSRYVLVNGTSAATFSSNTINQAAPASITSSTNYQLMANVANNGTAANIYSDVQTVSFIYPFLYGMSASSLTGSTIYSGLTKSVTAKATKSVTLAGTTSYIYFAYPYSYGALSQILDPNSFDITSSFTASVVYVTSTGLTTNWTTSYYLYKSELTTVNSSVFKFIFN